MESTVHLWMIKAMVFLSLLSLNQGLMTSNSEQHSKVQMQIQESKAHKLTPEEHHRQRDYPVVLVVALVLWLLQGVILP